jgi:hypothetical protein
MNDEYRETCLPGKVISYQWQVAKRQCQFPCPWKLETGSCFAHVSELKHDGGSSHGRITPIPRSPHNILDQAAVEVIARRLREEVHLAPFLDRWHLAPGEPCRRLSNSDKTLHPPSRR